MIRPLSPADMRHAVVSVAGRDPLKMTAAYYIAGGLWPIVHLRSFYAVTGRKREGWLVQSFGLFLAAFGAGLLPFERGDRAAQERIAVLGAASLATADAWFVARGRISPVYLADAAVEVALAAWILAVRRSRRGRRTAQ